MSNRAERRRTERAKMKGEAVYQVKFGDLERIHEEAINEATMRIVPVCLMASFEVLRTKFGFGKVRMKRFADAVFATYDAVDKQYVTFDDIAKAIAEETGVAVKRVGKDRFRVDTEGA